MAGNIKGITIEFGAKTTTLDRALKNIKSEARAASTQLNQINRALRLKPGNVELIGQKYRALSTKVQETRNKLNALRQADAQAKAQLERGEITQSEYDKLRRDIIQTEAELKKMERELRKVSNIRMEALRQRTEQLGQSFKKVGQQMQTVGRGFNRAVTLPIVAGLGAATKVTADFDKAISKVGAVSGASAQDLEAMRKKAREMGKTTKFSASEAAEAMNYMAMAGWKTGDILEGTAGIMNLAAASGADLATTSDIVTDALTAFGKSAKDSGRLADIMAAASSNANTNVEMMGETFKYAAPVAGTLGYSMEDTAVAIGLMANAGIKASQAGTSLRTGLTNLASPTGAAKSWLEKLGVQVTDSNGKMLPLNETIKNLRKGFSGLSESEQASAAKAIFGKQAMSGWLAIINASEGDVNKLTKAVNNSNGAAEKMAETMQDNLAGQLTILKSQLQELGISFGELLVPYIRQAVTHVQNFVDKLNSMDEETKKTVLKLLAFAAAAGPMLTATGKMSQGIGGLVTAFGRLIPFLVANPFAAVIAGAVALGAVTVALQMKQIKAAEAQYELTEEQKASIETLNAQKQAYDAVNQAREKAESGVASEYAHITDLKNEYNSLIDSNGKVKKGYEDRANYIIGKLASSLGVERSEIEKTIQANGKLGKAIDDVIEKKKAEAYINANQEAYEEALKNQTTLTQEVAKKSEQLITARQKEKQAAADLAEAQKTYNALLGTGQAKAAQQDVLNASTAYNKAKKNVNDLSKAYSDGEKTLEGYQTTIANFEGLEQAISTGDVKKIENAQIRLKNSFISAENGTKASLLRQKQNAQTTYDQIKQAFDSGAKGVTADQVAEAQKMVTMTKKEYDKYVTNARNTGAKAQTEFANSINSGKSKVSTAAAGVTSSVLSKLTFSAAGKGNHGMSTMASGINNNSYKVKDATGKAVKDAKDKADDYSLYDAGGDFISGFARGINNNAHKAATAAANAISKAVKSANKAQKSGSPSRVMAKVGGWFTEGYAEGITAMAPLAEKAAGAVSQSAIQSMQQGMAWKNNPSIFAPVQNATAGLPEMLDGMAGSLVNGLAGAITMNGENGPAQIVVNAYMYPGAPQAGQSIVNLYDTYKRRLG